MIGAVKTLASVGALCVVAAVLAVAARAQQSPAAPPRGWLGVRAEIVSAEAVAPLALGEPAGALVVGVAPGGPAARAGMRVGDVILAVGLVAVGDRYRLEEITAAIRPGIPVPVTIERAGERRQVLVTMAGERERREAKRRSEQAAAKYGDLVEEFRSGDQAAMRQLQPLAESGFAGAQRLLGYAHKMGQAVPQDLSLAAFWFRMAAEQGDAIGQRELGELYHGGLGIPEDRVRAYYWYGRSAEFGDASAGVMRTALAQVLSAEQIAEAESLAGAGPPQTAAVEAWLGPWTGEVALVALRADGRTVAVGELIRTLNQAWEGYRPEAVSGETLGAVLQEARLAAVERAKELFTVTLGAFEHGVPVSLAFQPAADGFRLVVPDMTEPGSLAAAIDAIPPFAVDGREVRAEHRLGPGTTVGLVAALADATPAKLDITIEIVHVALEGITAALGFESVAMRLQGTAVRGARPWDELRTAFVEAYRQSERRYAGQGPGR
jgi:hypothetical protein